MLDAMLFTDEEKIVINNAFGGGVVQDYEKESLIRSLTFSQTVTTEPEMIDLLKDIKEKVEDMNDEDWKSLKSKLPLNVSIEADDETEENTEA